MHVFERRKSQPVNAAAWRRYRVSQAHELRRRLRSVPAIAGALIVVSGITLVLRYPDYALGLALVSALAAFALFTFAPLARVLPPRGILALSFLMPATAASYAIGLIAVEPAMFSTAMASLAITPIGAPLLLAWEAPTNRRFLIVFAVVVSVLVFTTGLGWLSLDQRIDLASLFVMCCVVGVLVGNLLQDLRMQSIAQEIELRALNRQLHGYATTDPLTRLRNRRQLDGDVALIWPSIERGANCAVVMLDLDHFKRLNDERGHGAGDTTLRLVAIELQRQVRGRDSVYRVGGEEFLVLLRDTTLEGGLQVADRIRIAIAELGLPASGGLHPARLTISGGVALAGAASESWDEVVANADAALYAAKEAGRNRVLGPDGFAAEAA